MTREEVLKKLEQERIELAAALDRAKKHHAELAKNRDSAPIEDLIPGIGLFVKAVESASKMPPSELAKISPTMLEAIRQMQVAVAGARAQLDRDGAEYRPLLAQFVLSAEGAIRIAQQLIVVGPTGETGKSVNALDLIKDVRSAGGFGVHDMFPVRETTSEPESNVLKAVKHARNTTRISAEELIR